MDFYNMIKNLEKDQISELISFKIDQAKYASNYTNKRFIGVDCGINPSLTLTGENELDSQAMWNGFIPEDVKIIYSFVPNENGFTVNNGCYYYVDSHEYLYEFAMFIKDKNIKNDLEFLSYVYLFIDTYFYNLSLKDTHRKQMHKPLINQNGKYIESLKKHRFQDFKGSNNAECSEYSVLAENILSIFGYPILYLGGSVSAREEHGGHAFNLILINGKAYIIDFTIPIEIYTIDGIVKSKMPFIGAIDDFNSETLHDHLINQTPYDFNEYYLLDVNNNLMMVKTDSERHYVVGNVEYYNKKQKLEKTIKKI